MIFYLSENEVLESYVHFIFFSFNMKIILDLLLNMYENLKHDSGNSTKREKVLDKSAHDRNNGKFAGFNFNASFRAKINYKRLPGRSNSENHRIS